MVFPPRAEPPLPHAPSSHGRSGSHPRSALARPGAWRRAPARGASRPATPGSSSLGRPRPRTGAAAGPIGAGLFAKEIGRRCSRVPSIRRPFVKDPSAPPDGSSWRGADARRPRAGSPPTPSRCRSAAGRPRRHLSSARGAMRARAPDLELAPCAACRPRSPARAGAASRPCWRWQAGRGSASRCPKRHRSPTFSCRRGPGLIALECRADDAQRARDRSGRDPRHRREQADERCWRARRICHADRSAGGAHEGAMRLTRDAGA